MTVLPIVEHQLRVASRRWTTYWGRMFVAFVACFIGVGIVTMASATGPGGPGARQTLDTFSFGLFLYCLFAGIAATSDSVSREKREGTLGLLFLTDLKGFDVVFGKLAAGALRPVCNLLAMLPVLSLGLLVGALRWVDVIRLSAALLNTLFLSLAIGVCLSVFSWEQKRTQSNASGLAVLFWFILPALSRMLLQSVPGLRVGLFLHLISPSYAQSLALTPITGGPADFFWRSIFLVHLESWLFLALAIGWIPRCWRDGNVATEKTSWKERRQQWKYGRTPVRQRLRSRLLEINPFLWLVSRERFKWQSVWIFLGAGTGLTWFFVWMLASPGVGRLWLSLIISFGLWYLFLKLRLADEAGRQLAAQRSTGNLELILSTPLSVAEIIDGQWLALRRQFAGAIVVCLTIGLASLVLLGMLEPAPTTSLGISKANGVLALLAMMVVLVADAVALGWVGMWLGLKLRKPGEIAQGAVFRIMVLPSLLFVFLVRIASLWPFLSWLPNTSFAFKTSLWLALGLVNDLLFILVSRRMLHRRFRAYASRLYLDSGPAGLWGRWLGEKYARLRRRFSRVPAARTTRKL